MGAIDSWLEGLMHGQAGVGVILLISLLLGLRHASDPDHLAAVTTLIASEEARVRRAGCMGFLWGLGHGTTLVVVGLPLVFFNRFLPEPVQQGAEVAIGAIIVLLAARLLHRWRRGFYHAHAHSHDDGPPTITYTRTRARGMVRAIPTTTRTPSPTGHPSRPTVWGSCTASAARAASRCSSSRPSRRRLRLQQRS